MHKFQMATRTTILAALRMYSTSKRTFVHPTCSRMDTTGATSEYGRWRFDFRPPLSSETCCYEVAVAKRFQRPPVHRVTTAAVNVGHDVREKHPQILNNA